MKCPGCGEINEAGMQFCIFCGYGFAAPPPPQPVTLPPPVDDPSRMTGPSAQLSILVCTVCNKTDPLQGQFCVFCGQKTISSPLAFQNPAQSFSSMPAYSSVASMPAYSQSGMPGYNSGAQIPAMSQQTMPDPRHSEEFVRNVPPPPAPPKAGSAILGIVLAVILGAGASAGAVYYMKDDVEKAALSSSWPSDGVLILSNAPNADLRIDDAERNTLIVGRLSPHGNLHLPSISPGAYFLTLSDSSGKRYKQEFNVNPGGSNVIGYPTRIDLK